MEFDVFGFKLRREDSEGFSEFPFRANFFKLLDKSRLQIKDILPRGTSDIIIESSFEKERMSSTNVF